MRPATSAIRDRSRWFRRLATGILATLLLALLVEVAALVRDRDTGGSLAFLLSYRLPMIFYLAAIWAIRRAFGRLARGELFDRVLPTLLARLGAALACGAVASVLVSPWLLRLAGQRFGAFAAFDPAAITTGLVGLLLIVLSRLFAQAVAMRRELDEIL